MSSAALHFYDSANSHNVHSGVHAGVYINGLYAWSKAEQDRMAAIFSISVEREAAWARYARCLDMEAGAAQPEDFIPFLHHRWTLGFDDGTGYVNRSNWRQVAQLVKDAGLPMPLWWVATLDGTAYVEERLDDGTVLKPWAVQLYGGMNTPWDLSVLHGVNNFHKP